MLFRALGQLGCAASLLAPCHASVAPGCVSEALQHLGPLQPSSLLASQAPNHLLKSGQHSLEADGCSAVLVPFYFKAILLKTSDGASKGGYEGGQVAGVKA